MDRAFVAHDHAKLFGDLFMRVAISDVVFAADVSAMIRPTIREIRFACEHHFGVDVVDVDVIGKVEHIQRHAPGGTDVDLKDDQRLIAVASEEFEMKKRSRT